MSTRKSVTDSELAYRRYQRILQFSQVTITSVARIHKITIVHAEQRYGDMVRELDFVYHGNRELPKRVLGSKFHKVNP